jgi:hypothetical protein
MGKFGTLPWDPGRSKKIDLNGNELAITFLSDINNKKCMSKNFFSMIFESCRLLLLKPLLKFSFDFMPFQEQNNVMKNKVRKNMKDLSSACGKFT